MANLVGELPLTVSIEEQLCASQTTYAYTAGGLVLTISTVIPDPALACELHCTYTGHEHTDTVVTHLALGAGAHAAIDTSRHPGDQLNPQAGARACAYDHAHRLIDLLATLGHRSSVHLDEHTFTALERIQ